MYYMHQDYISRPGTDCWVPVAGYGKWLGAGRLSAVGWVLQRLSTGLAGCRNGWGRRVGADAMVEMIAIKVGQGYCRLQQDVGSRNFSGRPGEIIRWAYYKIFIKSNILQYKDKCSILY